MLRRTPPSWRACGHLSRNFAGAGAPFSSPPPRGDRQAEARPTPGPGRSLAVALAALPRRRSRAGFAAPDFELGGRRGSSDFGITWHHFAPGGKKLMDRLKPVSHVHLRRAVDPDSRNGAGRGPRRGDFGSKRRARGRDFAFEFGRWLAASTEQVYSRSPCGVRTRDECTKRNRRMTSWCWVESRRSNRGEPARGARAMVNRARFSTVHCVVAVASGARSNRRVGDVDFFVYVSRSTISARRAHHVHGNGGRMRKAPHPSPLPGGEGAINRRVGLSPQPSPGGRGSDKSSRRTLTPALSRGERER